MVSLLGSRDELLRVVEKAFDADIHVRGNEITVTGTADETALVARAVRGADQLLASGAELTADAVERSVAMLRRKSRRPAGRRADPRTSCRPGAGRSGRRR